MNKVTKFLIITFAVLGLNLSLDLSAIKYKDKASATAEFRAIMKSTRSLSGTRLKSEEEIQISRLQKLEDDLRDDDRARAAEGVCPTNQKLITDAGKQRRIIVKGLYRTNPPRKNPFLQWKLAKVSKAINSLGSNNVPIKYKH